MFLGLHLTEMPSTIHYHLVAVSRYPLHKIYVLVCPSFQPFIPLFPPWVVEF
jgi:hypothetical protein